MIEKIIKFCRDYQEEIVLLIGVFLISLLSFALGFIMAKQQGKEPIRIERSHEELRTSYESTNFFLNSYSFLFRNEI